MNDRMTSDNNASSRFFTSVCYSADGSCVLAGGNSKYICIYEVSQQILVKKFQISFNRSLDGILDELNSKQLADGGPIDVNDYNDNDEADFSALLPGARRGDDGSRKSKVEVLTSEVAFSSTGREWAAVSNEGLHIYSLDEEMIFDPIALTEEITPGAVQSNLRSGNYSVALLISLHLNEFSLVREVLDQTPFTSIHHVVKAVGHEHLDRLLQYISKIILESPHLEFYTQWCLELLRCHGMYMEKNRSTYLRAFRAMNRAVQIQHDDLRKICDSNKYMLDVVEDQSKLILDRNA
jgi:periodic tryptophan protein 2